MPANSPEYLVAAEAFEGRDARTNGLELVFDEYRARVGRRVVLDYFPLGRGMGGADDVAALFRGVQFKRQVTGGLGSTESKAFGDIAGEFVEISRDSRIVATLERVAAAVSSRFYSAAGPAFLNIHGGRIDSHYDRNLDIDPLRLGAFTAGVAHKNSAIPYHVDRGNVPETVTAVIFGKVGNPSGGFLAFPQLGIALAPKHGWAVLCRGDLVHGVTPIEYKSKDDARFSLVLHVRDGGRA